MDLRSLAPAAIMLVVASIVISVGADIVDTVQDDQTANSYAYNVSSGGLEGLEAVGDWLPTIGLVTAAVIVIGVIVKYFQG